MEAVRLSALDLTIVVLYLVAVTGFGLWASRGIRTSKDFFLAGRSLPWWVAGMSLVVSDIGAKDTGLTTHYLAGIVQGPLKPQVWLFRPDPMHRRKRCRRDSAEQNKRECLPHHSRPVSL